MTGDLTYYSKGWLIAGAASIIALVWLLSPILTPFFLGLLIAYLGQPVVNRLSHAGQRVKADSRLVVLNKQSITQGKME